MLSELWLYLTSGATRMARRSGLLKDSIGLWSRARRRRREWSVHYQRCHGVIREAIADMPQGGKVAVLGSGLAEDVPLEALAARFGEIILVDIVHLPPVRSRIAADPRLFRKVRFLTLDLTGVIADLAEQRPVPASPIDPLETLRNEPGLSLVISAMCLSQLPRAVLRLVPGSMSSAELEMIGKGVVERHLAGLEAFPCRQILLTDTAFTELAPDGSQISRHDLLHGAALPKPHAQWDWDVAPKGEVSGGISYRHHVGAWISVPRKSKHP